MSELTVEQVYHLPWSMMRIISWQPLYAIIHVLKSHPWWVTVHGETHCGEMGPYFRNGVPIGTFLTFWVLIWSLFIFQGSYLQSFVKIHVNSVCIYTTMSKFDLLKHNLLLKMVSIFVGTGSVLHCWQNLVFTSAYALNFINRRFGSLFWLL